MNPLIMLTTLAVWTAASSYSRYRNSQRDYELDENPHFNITEGIYTPGPGVASSSGSIHSPSSYLSSQRQAQIVSFSRDIAGSDSDATSFMTSNGISASHNVYLMRDRPSVYTDELGRTVQSDGNIAMSGHSTHTSPEGMQVSLTWAAATDQDKDSPRQRSQPHVTRVSMDHPAVQAEVYRQARHASLQHSTLYGGNGRKKSEKSPESLE